jgi:hypothetical protein
MLTGYERARQRNNEWRKRRIKAEREKVLAHYGTECVCCGATEKVSVFPVDNTPKHEWLTKQGKSSVPTGFNHQLVFLNFPEGYETRCMRCHQYLRGGLGCACGGKRDWSASENPEG